MIARLALRRIFMHIGSNSSDTALRVEFADGSVCQTYPSKKRGEVLIRFRTPRAELHTFLFFYEGLFDSFVTGDVDFEGEQPIATLARLGYSTGQNSAPWLRSLKNPLIEIHKRVQEWRQSGASRKQAICNAEFHYGLPSALFKAMLGETMGYSEGLWTPETTMLNQAKQNLYEYICRKLQLKPGMTVLEVGGGWGYMPIYMAKRHHVDVTVYNPVRSQNDYMRERFHRHGLSEKIRLVQGDHRDIAREGCRFDRFVSIGVHEHAGYGLKQYRLWAEFDRGGFEGRRRRPCLDHKLDGSADDRSAHPQIYFSRRARTKSTRHAGCVSARRADAARNRESLAALQAYYGRMAEEFRQGMARDSEI